MGKENIISVSGPVSYLVDLIIQISKTITKGRGLSKNGVNALLLFLLTAGLLFTHTEMPITYSGILKLYSVPLIFLIYFIVDLGKNIEKVNRFFKRLQQRTEFTYDNIMNGTFSFEQIKNIIEKLVNDGQFTPNVQNNLLRNEEIYRIDTLPYIKESLVNIDWAPSAVCIFLSKMSKNLPKEYLDKLIKKYDGHPSVLVALGYFHHYKQEESSIYFKIGYEFKYKKHLQNFFIFLSRLFMGFWLVSAALVLFTEESVENYFFKIFLGLSVMVLIILKVKEYTEEYNFIWAIKKHLKNFNTLKDNYVIEKIINDLDKTF